MGWSAQTLTRPSRFAALKSSALAGFAQGTRVCTPSTGLSAASALLSPFFLSPTVTRTAAHNPEPTVRPLSKTHARTTPENQTIFSRSSIRSPATAVVQDVSQSILPGIATLQHIHRPVSEPEEHPTGHSQNSAAVATMGFPNFHGPKAFRCSQSVGFHLSTASLCSREHSPFLGRPFCTQVCTGCGSAYTRPAMPQTLLGIGSRRSVYCSIRWARSQACSGVRLSSAADGPSVAPRTNMTVILCISRCVQLNISAAGDFSASSLSAYTARCRHEITGVSSRNIRRRAHVGGI